MFNLASRAKPYFGALVLSVALLTAGGVYSALRMPSGVYPEVTFPRLSVVAKKPGLAVANMEVQVTRPLEDALGSVIGVERVRANTIRGGCTISVDLAPGTDADRAELLAWSRIGAVRSQMPPDVHLEVEQMMPSVNPIISVVLTGGHNEALLHDYALFKLKPILKQIPGVYKAEVSGGDVREIEVEARPEALLAAGLSAADLADQIGKAHRLEPVGRVEHPPHAYQIMVDTQGEAARTRAKGEKPLAETQRDIVRSLEELVISSSSSQPLRVRDVAQVRILHQDRVHSVGSDGKPAVVITIFRDRKGNTVNISHEVHALLARHVFPPNMHAAVAYDQAVFVNDAVDNVRDAILIGGLFSILILLAFLRSWRATLISALAIPTTLAITFLFLHWQGGTLNLMSLGGLAVAIGLIIDDTVVVIENIARHLQAPKPGDPHPSPSPSRNGQTQDAVDAASGEITGAVIGSTLTTVLVFVPLAFIAGVYGQFFAALSWALCVAVLVSMVISLTLVPVFAAKFLAGRPMPEPGRIYNFLANGYERLLAVALRFPYATLAMSLAAIGVGIALFTGIPGPKKDGKPGKPILRPLDTGLMPSMDEGALVVDYFAPAGTPLDRTEALAKQIEDILLENPDVQVYVRRTGAELGIFATQSNRGDIQVMLRPAENDPESLLRKPVRPPFGELEKEKDGTPGELIRLGTEAAQHKYGPKITEKQVWAEGKAAIRKKYRRRPLAAIKEEIEDEIKEHFHEHQLEVEVIQVMQDELNDLSGADRPIEVKLFGPDHNKLRELGEEVAKMLEEKGKSKGIVEVNSHIQAGNPDLMIQLDKLRLARLGLTTQEVERQLKAIYLGQVATQVRESAECITDVRVRYPDSARFGDGHFRPDKVLTPLLLLPHGAPGITPEVSLAGLARSVPASAVAHVEPVRTAEQQVRENLQPAVIISAQIDESKTGLGKAVQDIRALMAEQMDKKITAAGCRWDIGGHYVKQREAFWSLAKVMVVAVLLVFIMLAFQLRSLVLPIFIFLTQPLSLVSGFLALKLTHTPLNMSSYMGAILLIGLDMKNGILLVEYIQQLRAEGMPLREALLLAGRTRFRPILMTSLAAILGLFPLALGIGPGAQMQQPLAIMVIGGLTANMLFTRVIIPVGYLLFERWRPEPPAGVALVPSPAPAVVVAENRVVPSV